MRRLRRIGRCRSVCLRSPRLPLLSVWLSARRRRLKRPLPPLHNRRETRGPSPMVSSRKPSLRDDPSPFSPSRGFFMVGFGWPPGRLPLVNLDADLLGRRSARGDHQHWRCSQAPTRRGAIGSQRASRLRHGCSTLAPRGLNRRSYLWFSLTARAFMQGATSFNSAIIRVQRLDATRAQNILDSHRASGPFFMCWSGIGSSHSHSFLRLSSLGIGCPQNGTPQAIKSH